MIDQNNIKKNTSWKFYTHSEDAWDAMSKSIEDARLSIDIEQYIFQRDVIGSKFIDLLVKKSTEGVKVRILCDEVGSFAFSNSKDLEQLKSLNDNIEIKFFNPLLPWKPYRETLWYFRDHRKLMIVDCRIGFTGSVCIGDEMTTWRESHIEIEDPQTIREMQDAFNAMWNKEYRKFNYIFKKNKNKEDQNNHEQEFRYVTNTPLPKKRYMYYELLRAIKKAKEYIYLTTPYFLPNSRLLREIKKAGRRGVKISLLLPFQSNHKIAQIGAETFFSDLLKENISIYLYDKMIHSKTIVIDDNWSTIGSLNLDNISLRYNFEGNLVSANPLFNLEIKKQFLEDLNKSKKLEYSDWKKRPLFSKFLEILVWPFRKFL